MPSETFSDYVTMIYGKKKIGKTSLANQFSKNMFHMMIEPQARALKMYQKACPTYEHVQGYVELLKKKGHDFDSVSVDPLPLFYQKSLEYAGKKYGFEHPSDNNDFGKSWNKVRGEFERVLLELLDLNIGLVFHAHETMEEVENRFGTKYKIIRPEGGTQVWEFVNAYIGNIFYFHFRGTKRYLQIRGDDHAFACCCHTDKFMTPDGEQIYAVPMGKSAEEGYTNLLNAFENKQIETYEKFDEEPSKPTRRKKKTLTRRKK